MASTFGHGERRLRDNHSIEYVHDLVEPGSQHRKFLFGVPGAVCARLRLYTDASEGVKASSQYSKTVAREKANEQWLSGSCLSRA